MNNRQKANRRLLRYRHAKRLSKNSSSAVFLYRIMQKFRDGMVVVYRAYTARPKPASRCVGIRVEDWHEVAERREKTKGDFERVLRLLGVRL